MSQFDPVCGMQVDATHAAGKAEYRGETYHFCSQACRDQFQRKPEQFVKKQTGSAAHPHRHT